MTSPFSHTHPVTLACGVIVHAASGVDMVVVVAGAVTVASAGVKAAALVKVRVFALCSTVQGSRALQYNLGPGWGEMCMEAEKRAAQHHGQNHATGRHAATLAFGAGTSSVHVRSDLHPRGAPTLQYSGG
jgi:hypothetical protein